MKHILNYPNENLFKELNNYIFYMKFKLRILR